MEHAPGRLIAKAFLSVAQIAILLQAVEKIRPRSARRQPEGARIPHLPGRRRVPGRRLDRVALAPRAPAALLDGAAPRGGLVPRLRRRGEPPKEMKAIFHVIE